jgi:predicted nucleotidyltransferase
MCCQVGCVLLELEEWLERPVDLVRLNKYMHPAFRTRLEREAIYV